MREFIFSHLSLSCVCQILFHSVLCFHPSFSFVQHNVLFYSCGCKFMLQIKYASVQQRMFFVTFKTQFLSETLIIYTSLLSNFLQQEINIAVSKAFCMSDTAFFNTACYSEWQIHSILNSERINKISYNQPGNQRFLYCSLLRTSEIMQGVTE